MKLVIQIPCHNEQQTLPRTLETIPRAIDGIDVIETQIIDDGSTDRTAAVARECGVDHIISLRGHQGLARGFQAGLEAALGRGADIIVNTDADNQYPQEQIPQLIAPIIAGTADMVIGDRGVSHVAHFSPIKRWLQALGSRVVSRAAGLDVPDVTSGFRALSRNAALRLSVMSRYTYTLETIIQAGKSNMRVASVPIEAQPTPRRSRLFSNMWFYVGRSAATIAHVYVRYEPLRTFALLSIPFLLAGSGAIARFVWRYAQGLGSGHIQSLVIGGTCLIVGFLLLLLGVVADLIAGNRRRIEEVLYRIRRMELKQ